LAFHGHWHMKAGTWVGFGQGKANLAYRVIMLPMDTLHWVIWVWFIRHLTRKKCLTYLGAIGKASGWVWVLIWHIWSHDTRVAGMEAASPTIVNYEITEF
jgi:hypothetical protein